MCWRNLSEFVDFTLGGYEFTFLEVSHRRQGSPQSQAREGALICNFNCLWVYDQSGV